MQSTHDTGPRLGGVLPVLQTPFDSDERIAIDVLENEIDWLFDQGVDGVVTGMVTEVLRLTADERDHLSATVCAAAGERGPAVISVGAESTRTAVRHSVHAEESGASAVMATAPMLTPLGPSEMLEYFKAIVAAVSIPVVIQDSSGYVGAALPISMQAELHKSFGNRVMFKPEAAPIGPRLTQLLEATGGQASVFEGTGGLHLIESYRRGAIGTMPGSEVAWAIVSLWNALQSSDFERAYRIAGPLALLVALQVNLDGFIAVEKALLVHQRIFRSPTARGPLNHGLDAETFDEAIRLMELLRAEVDVPPG